jgi:hypothetical protein
MHSLLTAALLAAQASVAVPTARLDGLDRLYFERVEGPGRPLAVPQVVGSLLPESIEPAGSARETADAQAQPADLDVRDFPLPLPRWPRELRLRQVIRWELPRISDLWWALYDGGRRTDVWHFRADSTRAATKILSNYEIEDVSAAEGDSLVLRVRGTMFRPQGAWSMTGKALTFSARGETLQLARVRNAFGFFRGYDIGGTPPSIDASTEREVGGRFEVRQYLAVPDRILSACGFRDPTTDEAVDASWADLEASALCVTKKPGARTSYRRLDEPSFVERGGGP